MKWKTLEHNGVLFPPEYNYQKISVRIKGNKITLNRKQEEMAWAWTKKKDTPYVKDKVFIKNFTKDFLDQFEKKYKNLSIEDFNFTEMIKIQEKEKEHNSKPKVKKKLAGERKEKREKLKEIYGYAVINGAKTEVGNYMVEPASIFMGRGEHPFRGKWKKMAEPEDIVLNLGKKAKVPNCPIKNKKWGKIIHDNESTWLAKWHDQLTNKDKYVWLSDTSTIRQEQDRAKYEKAINLQKSIIKIRKHIENNLGSKDEKIQKTATVAYLIDNLAMRVGDEKDEDEADTVGATTLRVEHITISGNKVEFDFLGKDSVRWKKTIEGDKQFVKNIQDFIKGKKPSEAIFDKISSTDVNKFLADCKKGITAKVFRTFHASNQVNDYLNKCGLKSVDDDYLKIYHAKMANLEAAIQCNHKKTPTKNWEESMKKKENKLKDVNKELKNIKQIMRTYDYECIICNKRLSINGEKIRCDDEKSHKNEPKLMKKLDRQKARIVKEKERVNKKHNRVEERLNKMKLKVDVDKKTKEYNLNTSLRNYIDPRIYKDWSNQVELDWNKLYPKTLQRKFQWIDSTEK
ncbi:MAG: DNA topoisomerase I [Nitrososphaerales archaeon]